MRVNMAFGQTAVAAFYSWGVALVVPHKSTIDIGQLAGLGDHGEPVNGRRGVSLVKDDCHDCALGDGGVEVCFVK
jgi:hypothetical protein